MINVPNNAKMINKSFKFKNDLNANKKKKKIRVNFELNENLDQYVV